ncbi:TRAP transporter large permease [Georgenia sp. H159]|uniref:TRAP transporter large permease n=1 Tax=Georgenia sp. H159 TaxID=3076115 RepID=UPI002D789B20|nr:TRAP transporter large permease [Georgenia sp. H159]
MDVSTIILITLLALVGLLVIKTPVALALGISGAFGLFLLRGFDYTTSVLSSTPFSTTSSFSLTIVPMFILMGLFAVKARVAESVFAVANHFVRRAPGGLGVATVMACAGFSAVSGSSIGTAATMSKLSVSEMRAMGYPASLATGLVAIAGTLGVMIPPSTFLVLYAIMTNSSVAQMLAAGIVPGLLSALAYIVYVMVLGQRKIGRSTDVDDLATAVSRAHDAAKVAAGRESRRGVASAGVDTVTAERPGDGPRRHTLRTLPWRGVVYMALLFVIVIGGMYSGIFTATESAAMGAIAAVIILVVENWKDGVKGVAAKVKDALLDTAATTSMVFFIIVGSAVLSAFFVAARVPEAITGFVSELGLPAMLTMALLLICLIPLGTVLESLSILVITVPILHPIAVELGFSEIWLGIMIVKLIELGMITPPVGINVFVVAGSTGVRPETVFKGVMPLFVVDLAITALLFLVPAITLFLPGFDPSS